VALGLLKAWGLQSEAYFCWLWIAAIAHSNPSERLDCLLLCLLCAVHVAAYAMCWSVVQGSPTECLCYVWPLNLKRRRPRPELGRWKTNTKQCEFISTHHFILPQFPKVPHSVCYCNIHFVNKNTLITQPSSSLHILIQGI